MKKTVSAVGALVAAAAVLTGCAPFSPSSPEPSESKFQVDTGDALNDAVYGPTWQVPFANAAASWDAILTESTNLCLSSQMSAPVDPAAFDAAVVSYNDAQAQLTVAGRPGPTGLPPTVPAIDRADWCSANGVLKQAR